MDHGQLSDAKGRGGVNRSTAFQVKGWCPGALRPMQSGDGLVVRIRPQSATLSPHELTVLADAARRFGTADIDLTRRANLQLRGVSESSLPSLHDVIARLGRLDDSPDGEAVRNVMISPLAGIDPAEVLDVRSLGREIARRLTSEKSLWALPSKFGFIVDGGGVLSLAEQRADVRLLAIARGREVALAVGLGTRLGVEWLGSIPLEAAVAIAIEIGLAFIDVASREPRQRMRGLSDEGLALIRSAMKSRLDRLHESPRQAALPPKHRVGLIELGAAGSPRESQQPLGGSKLSSFASSLIRSWRMAVRRSGFRLGVRSIPGYPAGRRHWPFLMPPHETASLLIHAILCSRSKLARALPLVHRPPWIHVATGAGSRVCCLVFISPGRFTSPVAQKVVRSPGQPISCLSVVRIVTASPTTQLRRITQRAIFLSPSLPPIPAVFSAPTRATGMTELRSYIRDGAEIYRHSFEIIRAESSLSRFGKREEKVVVRMIHACGMVDIADDVLMSPTFAACASEALLQGAPILCDAKMVAHGITRGRLPKNNSVICTLEDPGVAHLAAEIGTPDRLRRWSFGGLI